MSETNKAAAPAKSKAMRTVMALVLLALLGGIGYSYYELRYGPPKPWYARWQIKRFLKKQTGATEFKSDFNFNLAGDVAKLQAAVSLLETNMSGFLSNSARLQKEITGLHRLISAAGELARKQTLLSNRQHELEDLLAKIPDSLTNQPLATLTNTAALQKEVDALKAVVDPVFDPLKPLRDEIAALEKQVTEKQQGTAPKRREIAALLKQAAAGTRLDGTNEVKLTEAELTGLTNQIAALRAELAPTQAEIADLNKQVNAKQQEHNEKMQSVGPQYRLLRSLRGRLYDLSYAQTNVVRLQVDVTGARQDVATRAKDLGLAPGTAAEYQKTLAAKQKELVDLRQKHNAQVTELAAKRKDLLDQKNLLDAQQTNFAAQFKKKYDEAKTWVEMYRLLGQQLWVADQLLNHSAPAQQRIGLAVAVQAAAYSANIIENQWLAARIGEAYLLPNLALADETRAKAMLNPDNLLQQCIGYYRESCETNHVVSALKLSLDRAKTPRAKDYAWYLLGREYQQSSDYAKALSAFKSIQETNNFRWAMQQIPWLESRVKKKE